MSVEVSIEPSTASKSIPFSLLAFPLPPTQFQVHSFRATERISKPYAFDVTVSSPLLGGIDLEQSILGQSAAFVLRVGRAPRSIHGVVASIRSEGARQSHDAAQYCIRIAPQFALLRRARTSRVYQNMTVPDVVDAVLKGAGITTRWQLSQKYPVRAYVTQYQESTRDFVERLLAEAGIFYSFAHPLSLLQQLEDMAADALAKLGPLGAVGAELGELGVALLERETMVFGDDPSAYAPIDDGSALATVATAAASLGVPTEISVGGLNVGLPSPVLSYLLRAGMATSLWDKVTEFSLRDAVRATQSEVRNYDPDRPQFPLIASEPKDIASDLLSAAGGVAAAAVTDPKKAAGAALEAVTGALLGPKLELYEHHSPFHFPDWADVQTEAGRVLRAERRHAATARGASGCSAFSPGYRFRLEDHPIGSSNGDYVLTGVRHRGAVGQPGAAAELYRNEFDCVLATVTYPPKRRDRPHVHAALTATVVGPAGEDIWVDSQGRIKVHFHWDREGSGSGDTSCWIRSMQAWGGAGWGAQFIPRVGMEVVVVFDGGDPDKPLVIGSVYNGTHPMPFAVPADKTRSGIRTRSVGGSAGANELSFEDASSNEQIYLHAQRDLDEVVNHDHTLSVRNDERLRVDKNRTAEVGGDNHEKVEGNDALVVQGDHSVQVQGSRVDAVSGNLDARVSGVRTLRVEQQDMVDVAGAATHHYLTDFTARVEGNQMVIVGRNDRQASLSQHVEGVTRISSTGVLELASDEGIVLRVGKSTLRIGADGIQLDGAAVTTTGGKGGFTASDDGISLSSKGAAQFTSQSLVLTSSGGSISMGSEVKIDGSKILLNSPDKASDPKPKDPDPPTRIELKDQDGNPIPNQRFVVTFDDGSQRSGVLGADGTIELDLTKSGTVGFPDLTNVSA